MVKSKENLIGAYAFLAGVILAIALGLFQEALGTGGNFAYMILVILGVFTILALNGKACSDTPEEPEPQKCECVCIDGLEESE